MLFNENRIRRLFWVFLIVLSGGLIIFAALKTFEENLVFSIPHHKFLMERLQKIDLSE